MTRRTLLSLLALQVSGGVAAAAPPPTTCAPFAASLNNTHCPGMARAKGAPDASAAACRAHCCALGGGGCNAWLWHDALGGQCHVSPAKLSPPPATGADACTHGSAG